MYIWSKQKGLPGRFWGRPSPAHEFIFHFNKEYVEPNKYIKSSWAGTTAPKNNWNKGTVTDRRSGRIVIADRKIPESVFSVPTKGAQAFGHPAVFPVLLPMHMQMSYSKPSSPVYDPFAGTGSSALAAEQIGRVAYCMEISEKYSDIAIERWHKRNDRPQRPKKQKVPPAGQLSLL